IERAGGVSPNGCVEAGSACNLHNRLRYRDQLDSHPHSRKGDGASEALRFSVSGAETPRKTRPKELAIEKKLVTCDRSLPREAFPCQRKIGPKELAIEKKL